MLRNGEDRYIRGRLWDVAIVGGGNAALTAAITARDARASMLQRALPAIADRHAQPVAAGIRLWHEAAVSQVREFFRNRVKSCHAAVTPASPSSLG
jgi:hypothetical protein